jgi:hypothetical protein
MSFHNSKNLSVKRLPEPVACGANAIFSSVAGSTDAAGAAAGAADAVVAVAGAVSVVNDVPDPLAEKPLGPIFTQPWAAATEAVAVAASK